MNGLGKMSALWSLGLDRPASLTTLLRQLPWLRSMKLCLLELWKYCKVWHTNLRREISWTFSFSTSTLVFLVSLCLLALIYFHISHSFSQSLLDF